MSLGALLQSVLGPAFADWSGESEETFLLTSKDARGRNVLVSLDYSKEIIPVGLLTLISITPEIAGEDGKLVGYDIRLRRVEYKPPTLGELLDGPPRAKALVLQDCNDYSKGLSFQIFSSDWAPWETVDADGALPQSGATLKAGIPEVL